MSYRSEQEKRGFVAVFFRDGTRSLVARNEYEPLSEALRRGDEWYEATDLYGDQEMVRLSCVVKIAEATPQGIAAWDANDAEEAAYKKAHGED